MGAGPETVTADGRANGDRNGDRHPLSGAQDAEFHRALADAVDALERAEVPYVLMGGMGSATFGRPRWTHDIDFFVRPEAADAALDALGAAGFDTEKRDPRWLFKAYKYGVLVDVIFRSAGDIYLDEEMLARSRVADVGPCRCRLIPPEDLLVIKAVASDEHVAHHWYDALGIIGSASLDWDYLVSRASRHGTRRVLALLLYALSDDLGVPLGAVRTLYDVALSG